MPDRTARALVVVALSSGVLAGCGTMLGLDAPLVTGAFAEDPEAWRDLPVGVRYERAYDAFESGASYARSGAIREESRLIGNGAERAATGLRYAATLVAVPAQASALKTLAEDWHKFAEYCRGGGRLFRPRAEIDALAVRARPFRPGAVTLIQPPAPASAPATAPAAGPAAAAPVLAALPAGAVEGVVLRKRSEVVPGPKGEETRWIITLFQPGGVEREFLVDESRWRACELGRAVPEMTPALPKPE